MKRLLILLCLLLLLTGCRTAPPLSPPETEVPTDSAQTSEPAEQTDIPLLDQAEVNGNLMYIPNAHVESMACPDIRLYGNGLLLYEYTMDGRFVMKRISLEDGRLLAEASYDVSPAVQVQIGNGFIGLSDCGTGQVLILNDSLELETTYSLPPEGDSWCLNQELETLYVFYSEEGLLVRDLASGESWWILDNVTFVRTLGEGNSYVLISYTDRASQKTYIRSLNLSTATLETLPVEGSGYTGVRNGDQWLLRQNVDTGTYVLINQDTASTFAYPEGVVELISGRRQLLMTDGTYRNLYLYDLSGKFLFSCALSRVEYASVGTDLVWSGYWQGYFFRDTYDNAAHLMFWDTSVPQEGEDLPLSPMGDVQSSEPMLEQELYRRAEEISRRFGVDVRIGEQCQLYYSHYRAEMLKDAFFVREALDILEEALSDYPEDFFRQLPYGSISEIRIELVKDLGGIANDYPADVNGFAQEKGDHFLVVLDGFVISRGTVYHELSHVIDKRLEWDAMLRPDALYSEEVWLSLQPAGFRYAMAYTDMPPEIQEYEDSGYFVKRYSMTFPTEDRATLMELFMNDSAVFRNHPAMEAKMDYYIACIRDCFGTEGWLENTAGE